jgi:hypothetical protein
LAVDADRTEQLTAQADGAVAQRHEGADRGTQFAADRQRRIRPFVDTAIRAEVRAHGASQQERAKVVFGGCIDVGGRLIVAGEALVIAGREEHRATATEAELAIVGLVAQQAQAGAQIRHGEATLIGANSSGIERATIGEADG